ncbi:hypothetical protein HYT74_03730 [Candidatus Daviesbacteria bacterium]|nr:hypothetical protein [Candidatus Daviesbacteria bacterium]
MKNNVEVFDVGQRLSVAAYVRAVQRTARIAFEERHTTYVIGDGPVSVKPIAPEGSINFNQPIKPD